MKEQVTTPCSLSGVGGSPGAHEVEAVQEAGEEGDQEHGHHLLAEVGGLARAQPLPILHKLVHKVRDPELEFSNCDIDQDQYSQYYQVENGKLVCETFTDGQFCSKEP